MESNETARTKSASNNTNKNKDRQQQQQPQPVTCITSNDVLLGRGKGVNQYIGNQRFHELIGRYKVEYNATRQHRPKKKIAQQIVDRIHSLGGRFLRRDERETTEECCSVQEGTWYVVNDKTALEKCKQALRERTIAHPTLSVMAARAGLSGTNWNTLFLPQPTTTSASPFSAEESVVSSDIRGGGAEEVVSVPLSSHEPSLTLSTLQPVIASPSLDAETTVSLVAAAIQQQQQQQPAVVMNTSFPTQFLNMFSSSSTPILLPRTPQQEQQQQCTVVASTSSEMVDEEQRPNTSSSPVILSENNTQVATSIQPSDDAKPKLSYDKTTSQQEEQSAKTIAMDVANATTTSSSTNNAATKAAGRDDVSDFILSAMALSGRTIFSEQETESERANMTNDERATLLADIFGKYCQVQPPRRKRPRRDLDEQSMALLVKQMRLELERIPLGKKRAMVEAQRLCHSEEFDDAKLARFLRCTGMDVQLAAQRFVNYWKCRREVFGPEKFAMRMTLSEALRDDLVAMEACVFCLLPRLDASDRPVQYLEPARHTGDGYTSESLLRAIWYVVEVTAEYNTDPNGYAIQVTWVKNMTIWEYDVKIYDKMHQFEASAWPLRICAFHVCCAPAFVHKILKPVMFALTDKESRTRTLFHDVPEEEIFDELSTYGLYKDMLPTFMGGNYEVDQLEWIANRRAAELEEL